MNPTPDVPVLTSEDARDLMDMQRYYHGRLAAIRDKRTKCIRVRSEDELREMFYKWLNENRPLDAADLWNTWLACARALELIREGK